MVIKCLYLYVSVLTLMLSACSVNKSLDTSRGVATLVTDAKERVISVRDALGGEYLGRLNPKQVLCTEPSPDIAQAVSDAVSANLGVEKGLLKIGGAISNSYAESVVQLGERLGTIQLLRDKMYRACEAYANGAISATTYTLLMSRLDKSLTTLMLAEMSAGAFGRASASIGGAAQSSAIRDAKLQELALKAVQDADQKVKAQEKDTENARKAAEQAPTDEAKQLAYAQAKITLASLQDELKEKQTTLSAVLHQVSLSTSTYPTSSFAGGMTGHSFGSGETIAQQISAMQQQYLDTDNEVTLLDACITALDLVAHLKPEAASELNKVNENLEALNQQLQGYEIIELKPPDDLIAAQQAYAGRQATLSLPSDASPLARYCYEKGMRDITKLASDYRKAKILKETAKVQLVRERLAFCNKLISAVAQPDLIMFASACMNDQDEVKESKGDILEAHSRDGTSNKNISDTRK